MEYKTKSAMVGRKKSFLRKLTIYIALFDINNPDKSTESPKKILEFPAYKEVLIEGTNIKYLAKGNDIVINDLESINIIEEETKLIIKTKHN